MRVLMVPSLPASPLGAPTADENHTASRSPFASASKPGLWLCHIVAGSRPASDCQPISTESGGIGSAKRTANLRPGEGEP
jgi:hypothetical protein